MNIYHYNNQIVQAIYDRDGFIINVSTDLSVLYIDEVIDNKELCKQLAGTANLTNIAGETRYYIQAGELHERDGWEQQPPEGF